MSISISREERLRHITLPTSFSEAFELAIKLSEEEQKERTTLLPKKQTQIIHLNDPSSSSSSKPVTHAVIDEDSKHDQSPYPSTKPKHQHRSRHFSTETPQPKPKAKETIMSPDDKMMLKLQFDLAGVMKKNQGKVNLEGTKMYQGKTTEYYLNTIIVETKPNQNGKEIIKNFPLDKPRNIKECLNKSNVQTFKNNASRLTTRLPEYSFTPIPRIKKDVALSKQEVNEIKSGQRIAVGLRRMEYAKQLREQQGLGCKKDKVVSRGTDRFIKKMKKKRKRRWVKRFKRRSSMKIKKKRSSNKCTCSHGSNNSRKEKIVFVDSVSGNDSEDVSIESCNSKQHSKRSISVDSAKNNNNNNNSIEEETNKTKVSLRSKNRNNSARTPYKIYENKLNSKTVYHPGSTNKWKYPEKAKAKLSQLDALLKAKHIKLSFPRFICNIPKRKPLVVDPFNFNKVKLHYNSNNNDYTVPKTANKKKQLSTDKQRKNMPLMKYDKNILDKLPLFDKWLKKKQLQQCFPKLIMGLLSNDNECYKEDKVQPISVIPKQTIRSNKHVIVNDDKDKDKVSEGFPSMFSDFFEQQINEEDMPQVLDTVKTKFQRDSKELLPFKDEIPLNLQKELQLKTLNKGKEKLLHKDDNDNDNDDISSISNKEDSKDNIIDKHDDNGDDDDDDAGQFGIIQLTPMDKEDDKKASHNDKCELHDAIISLKQPVEHESECNNNSNNSESEDSSSDALKNEVEVKRVDGKSPTRNVSLNDNKKGDTTMVNKVDNDKEMFTKGDNEDDIIMRGNYDAIGNGDTTSKHGDDVVVNVNMNAPHKQSGSEDKGEDKSDLRDNGNKDEQYRDASPIGVEKEDVKKSNDLPIHKVDSREMVVKEDKKELPTCAKQGDSERREDRKDKQVLSDDDNKSSLSDKNIGDDNEDKISVKGKEDKDIKIIDDQTEKEYQKDEGSCIEVPNESNKEQEKLPGFVDEQKEIPKDIEDKDSLPIIDNKDKEIQPIDDLIKPKETEQAQNEGDNTKVKEDIHPIDKERNTTTKEQLPLTEEPSTVKEEGIIEVKEKPKNIQSIEDSKDSSIKEEDVPSPKKLETLNNLEEPSNNNQEKQNVEQEKDNKKIYKEPIEDISIIGKEQEPSPIKEKEIINVPSQQSKDDNDAPLIEEHISPHHQDTQLSLVKQIEPDNVSQPTIKENENIQDKELDNKVIPDEEIVDREQQLKDIKNKLISEEQMKTDIIPSELEKEFEKEAHIFPIDKSSDIQNKDESSPIKGGINDILKDNVLLDKLKTELMPY